jgi:putative (di)nucleoside polyphosphate hydrolase
MVAEPKALTGRAKDALPYRAGVGMMILNPQKQVFVAQRIDNRTEAWQMPQGGMDAGETPEAALWREMLEEIGTCKGEILQETDWLTYDLPSELVPRVWGGKYRGQRQKWFLLRFTGEDQDIVIDTEEPEFCDWQWLEPHKLPSVIVPFKRDLYTRLLKIFAEHL